MSTPTRLLLKGARRRKRRLALREASTPLLLPSPKGIRHKTTPHRPPPLANRDGRITTFSKLSRKKATRKGTPPRDPTPEPKPYTSLVPPTSPWNTYDKAMIGFHSHTGVAISPTLLFPERYQWLYETQSRLHNQTDFTQDLLGLMSR